MYRACKACTHAAWKKERDKERASKAGEQVRRAATLTGLHDKPAAVALQGTGNLSLVVSSPLPVGQSIPRDSGRSRGGQPRSDTRTQEAVALVGEMVSLFVKATDKDEARMRAKLTGMKLENLRKERDCWRKTRGDKTTSPGQKGRSVATLSDTGWSETKAQRGV